MKKLTSIIAAAFLAAPLFAGSVAFDGSWTTKNFPLKTAAQFSKNGGSLGIINDAGVSVAYRGVSQSDWGSNSASWKWAVEQSVAATNLRNKGGDDRNMSIYFVFSPLDQAEKLSKSGALKLLSNSSIKSLVYTHGGSDGRGASFSNPYMKGRGQTVVLRGSETGSWNENVNLAADYAKAFGREKGALIGIAITTDSDDTDGMIKANISGLKLGQ